MHHDIIVMHDDVIHMDRTVILHMAWIPSVALLVERVCAVMVMPVTHYRETYDGNIYWRLLYQHTLTICRIYNIFARHPAAVCTRTDLTPAEAIKAAEYIDRIARVYKAERRVIIGRACEQVDLCVHVTAICV
jgi:hypothetical protein